MDLFNFIELKEGEMLPDRKMMCSTDEFDYEDDEDDDEPFEMIVIKGKD